MRNRRVVLIVEDSPTQAQQLSLRLAQNGVKSRIVEDGLAGLRAVRVAPPDAVVLDINLPSLDGYQVCRRLKRDPRTSHIPVLMYTEREGLEDTARGLMAGADGYIPKDETGAERLLDILQSIWLVA